MSAERPMTNRDRIMAELAMMDNQAFYKALAGEADPALTDRLCHRCEQKHGGKCPLGEDDCLLWDGSWLEHKWEGEALLEVRT